MAKKEKVAPPPKVELSKKDIQVSISRLEKDIGILAIFAGQEEWPIENLKKMVDYLKYTLFELK